MEPVYKSGDRVVVFNWGKFKGGDVVVFRTSMSLREERSNLKRRLPRNPSNDLRIPRNDEKIYMIKRIDKIDNGLIFVSGDNAKSSSKIGPVKLDQIVGKVILKY